MNMTLRSSQSGNMPRNNADCSRTSTHTGSKFRLQYTFPDADDDDVFDGLQDLLSQTWTIFGVSALFGFHSDETHLKKYSKRLREEIASNLTQENVSYNVKFFILDDTGPRPSPNDPPPIKIEVYSESINEQSTNQKCIYKGMLVSWHTDNKAPIGKSLRMPLLLSRGIVGTTEVVHATLELLFDCMVTDMPVTMEDLMWLLPISIADEEPKASDEIKTEYIVPGLPVSESIAVKYKTKDLINILEIIMEGERENNTLLWEHVERFHTCLHKQMLEVAGIRLGLCSLRRLDLPFITIMGNRVKVKQANTMNRILYYLNEKALSLFHTL